MFRLRIEIESAKFNTKLASQCLDRKWSTLRQLRKTYADLTERNTEKGTVFIWLKCIILNEY